MSQFVHYNFAVQRFYPRIVDNNSDFVHRIERQASFPGKILSRHHVFRMYFPSEFETAAVPQF